MTTFHEFGPGAVQESVRRDSGGFKEMLARARTHLSAILQSVWSFWRSGAFKISERLSGCSWRGLGSKKTVDLKIAAIGMSWSPKYSSTLGFRSSVTP